MANPQLRPPRQPSDPEQRWMALARVFAGHSADPTTKVGCIAVRQDRLIAHACNGLPRGIHPSELRRKDRDERLRLTIDAETALIARAARDGICLAGTTIYSWPLICRVSSATLLVEADIKTIVVPDIVLPQRWQEIWDQSTALFIEAGISVVRLDDESEFSRKARQADETA